MSVSGDGGFLFSAMELETGARLKCNLVHVVWIDGFYDMVDVQTMAKYGRLSGVKLGPVEPSPRDRYSRVRFNFRRMLCA